MDRSLYKRRKGPISFDVWYAFPSVVKRLTFSLKEYSPNLRIVVIMITSWLCLAKEFAKFVMTRSAPPLLICSIKKSYFSYCQRFCCINSWDTVTKTEVHHNIIVCIRHWEHGFRKITNKNHLDYYATSFIQICPKCSSKKRTSNT